jgi:hypothetical protein
MIIILDEETYPASRGRQGRTDANGQLSTI